MGILEVSYFQKIQKNFQNIQKVQQCSFLTEGSRDRCGYWDNWFFNLKFVTLGILLNHVHNNWGIYLILFAKSACDISEYKKIYLQTIQWFLNELCYLIKLYCWDLSLLKSASFICQLGKCYKNFNMYINLHF